MKTSLPENKAGLLIYGGMWVLGCSLCLYLAPSLMLDLPVWRASGVQPKAMLVLAFVHAFASIALLYRHATSTKQDFLSLIAFSLSACGVFTLYAHLVGIRKILILLPWAISPPLLVGQMLLLRSSRTRLFKIAATIVLLGSLAFLALIIVNPGHFLENFRPYRVQLIRKLKSKGPATARLVTSRLTSAYYPLQETRISDPLLLNGVPGGGWSKLDADKYLLCTGEGKLFVCSNLDDPKNIEIKPLNFSVPLNREKFIAEARSSAVIRYQWFRVASAFACKEGNETSIYTIYHHWKSEDQRFYVRLATARMLTADLINGRGVAEWKVLWESTPGLPVHDVPKPGKLAFAGLQIGGRIVQPDSHSLIFTIGDHEFDGVNADQIYPQDPTASYGKTYLYRKDTGMVEPYTLGNRNPQGLHIGSDGRIWETEHGPQGGDELNLLLSGHNYGWPLVTLGTEYLQHIWPLARSMGDHSGYTSPTYAWGKSIGISNLVEMRGDRFPAWRGNLLIGSLRQSLYRVKLEGDRVLSIEDIQIGMRIRDITETPGGRLALWSDWGEIAVIEPVAQQILNIPVAFGQCIVCHSPYIGSPNGAGPYLWGLPTRDIASANSFPYSQALRQLGGKWNREKLDTFLSNPQAMAPGTTMGIPGVTDRKQREEIIDFLLKLQ